jgi:hypothetical protein
MDKIRGGGIRYFSHTADSNVCVHWAPACEVAIVSDPHDQNTATGVGERSNFPCKFAALRQIIFEFDPLAFTTSCQRDGRFGVACQEAPKNLRTAFFIRTFVRGGSIFMHPSRLSHMGGRRVVSLGTLAVNSRFGACSAAGASTGAACCSRPRGRVSFPSALARAVTGYVRLLTGSCWAARRDCRAARAILARLEAESAAADTANAEQEPRIARSSGQVAGRVPAARLAWPRQSYRRPDSCMIGR